MPVSDGGASRPKRASLGKALPQDSAREIRE
jgi:hypothetical protein